MQARRHREPIPAALKKAACVTDEKRCSGVVGDTEYILEALREGAEFTLYRGRERGDLTPILAVAPVAERPSPQSLQRLEHEYALATELDPAWAAQPSTRTPRHEPSPLLIAQAEQFHSHPSLLSEGSLHCILSFSGFP